MRLASVTLMVALLTGPGLVEAESAAHPPGKIAKIGYLTNDSVAIDLPRRRAFQLGLRDLGYIERQNVIIEHRVGEGDSRKLPSLAAELLDLKVDVLFAFTASAIQAAKDATRDVPIVFVAHTPVELGFVASLARPGNNLTGLSLSAGPEIYGKLVELLGELVPKLTRVAVVWNPVNAANVVQLKQTQSAAETSRVSARAVDVRRPDELEAAFIAMKQERAEAFIVLADPMLLGERRRIADLAVKNGLPSIFGIPEHVDAGGLISYAADRLDVFHRAALHVDKILKGAKPADLPVEQPTKFELIVNVKTAKALGLNIPQSLLLRADKVID